jgi:hypothetical protein
MYNPRFSLILGLQQHHYYIPRPISIKFLSRAAKVKCSSGIFAPSQSSVLCNSNYKLICAFPRTCIHKFQSSRLLTSPNQTSPAAITAITQSPAIDVVGLGFMSGEISVYDIRADERLMRMFMEGGGIRALGFRSGRPLFCLL